MKSKGLLSTLFVKASYSIVQAGLEPLLPVLPPQCWDQGQAPTSYIFVVSAAQTLLAASFLWLFILKSVGMIIVNN